MLNRTLETDPITYHRIWALAWPLMLSNISIPLLGIVDTAILGHLDSPTYLGAVSVGGSIMAMVAWTFSFLRTSTTGLTAQLHGANNSHEIELGVARAVALSLLIGLVLLLLRDFLLAPALIFVDASEQVDKLALSYSQIRFYSLPAVLVTYCLSGWMIGVQNTRAVMLVIITTNVLNIVLDYLLIMKLGLNSDGAAWATVISEYTGCLIALGVFVRRHSVPAEAKVSPTGKKATVSLTALLDGKTVKKLLQMNADLMLRTFCLLFCFLFFTAQGAQQGDTILAANAILLQLVLLAAFALDGFAHAAESLCGYAIGKRSNLKFQATVRACLICCVGASVVITLALLASQHLIVYSYSSIEAVQAELSVYFVWLLAMPMAAVWCYLFDGVFIGAAQTAAMRNSMLACALFVFLPLWYLTLEWGNHGLWFAFTVFNLARGVALAVYYRVYSERGRWIAPLKTTASLADGPLA
ncbi:MAG: MATE family efflux transporter [Pseudomonadota bacterium]